jgi:S-adenosyl methyltransferase
VDNDPIVATHAKALMTSGPDGATAFIQADLHHPEKILADPLLAATLDLGEPEDPRSAHIYAAMGRKP